MNKIAAVCISLIILIGVLAACGKEQSTSEAALLPQSHYGEALHMQEQREALFQFVIDQQSGSYGVYTNHLDTNQTADVATGHEVLSESAGLLMRYYALTGQQAAFEAEWLRAKGTFDLTAGFSYRYSPLLQKKYTLNAAVDDLRIIRALYEAGAVFEEPRYTTEADHYGSRFYQYNIKNNDLYDFYDEQYSVTNDFITLCYIDLKSLAQLPIAADDLKRLTANMKTILSEGYLSDQFPLYETRYAYKTDSYSSDHINTVESLLTILSLAEVQQHNPASIRYLKEKVQSGTLYGQYTKEGQATNQVQSTAIYAIAAMIGSVLEDKQLYEDSIGRMNAFQVKDKASALNGGFGDVASKQAYSFDNLMALLAYAY